jgi:hypothetical protein
MASRFQHWDQAHLGTTNWIFGNLFGHPSDRNSVWYYHRDGTVPQVNHATYYVYHNNFVGGYKTLALGGGAYLTNVHFLNNIFSGARVWSELPVAMATSPGWVGEFDYNVAYSASSLLPTTHPWYGEHNKDDLTAYVFPDDDPITDMSTPDVALNVGTDVTAFGWPGYAGEYYGGTAPDAGIEQSEPPSPDNVYVVARPVRAYELGEVPAVFYFTRTGSSGEITVDYTITGTATAAQHYIAFSDSVVIADGQTASTATVTPVNNISTDERTVIVTVDAGTGYSVGAPASATITIIGSGSPVNRGRPPAGHVTAPRRL